MKFPKVMSKQDIIYAALIGSGAGIIGVLFFVIILNSMSTQGTDQEVIPVQSNEKVVEEQQFSETFYANQHGMFSSFESATAFTSGYPSLNTSVIVEVDGSYFIWSSVSTTKEGVQISDNPASFVKEFTFIGESCKEPKIQNLPAILKSDDRSNFYFEGSEIPEEFPTDWKSVSAALSTLTEDLAVTRLHLLSHYYSKNDCLKIQF